jgi:hypothetical protein
MTEGDAAPTTYTLTLTARQRTALEAILNETRTQSFAEGLADKGVGDFDNVELDRVWRLVRNADAVEVDTDEDEMSPAEYAELRAVTVWGNE